MKETPNRITCGLAIFFCMLITCDSFFLSFSSCFLSFARIAAICWERHSDVSFCMDLYCSHPMKWVTKSLLMPLLRKAITMEMPIIVNVDHGIAENPVGI